MGLYPRVFRYFLSAFLLSVSLCAQQPSYAEFTRTTISIERPNPPIHYWSGVDDTGFDVVVLTPTKPAPNGFGLIDITSGQWQCPKAAQQIGQANLNHLQGALQRGYTVFMVGHPSPSNHLGLKHPNPAGHPVLPLSPNAEPGYTIPEIKEFLERVILDVKSSAQAQATVTKTNQIASGSAGHGIFGWDSPDSWAITGGSSGGHLSLYIALQQTARRKNAEVVDHSTGLPILDPTTGNPIVVDTGVGAVAVRNPGTDALNWRFLGDRSQIWRFASQLIHADVSTYPDPANVPNNFAAPTTLALPSHLNPSEQFVYPTSTAPLDGALLANDNAFLWPEIYLKLDNSNPLFPFTAQGLKILDSSYLKPIQFDFSVVNDEAANLANSPYPPPPADWVNFISGHRLIDLLEPAAPIGAYPSIRITHGSDDQIVPIFQLERFDAAITGMVNPPIFEKAVTTGTTEHHDFRDMSRDYDRLNLAFFDREIRGILDADDDGLPFSLDPDDSDPDIDGDGQRDGDEYDESISSLGEVNDSTKTFRITNLERSLVTTTSGTATNTKWQLKITFEGHSGNASDYVVQACNWLFSDEQGVRLPDVRYPIWRDFGGASTIVQVGGAGSNLYECTVTRGVAAPAPEKFYRIAFRPGGAGTYAKTATAPVGLEKRTIRRNQIANTTANLICSGFTGETHWRGKVNTPTLLPGTNKVTLNLGSNCPPIAPPLSTPPAPFAASETDRAFTHYAILQVDEDIRTTPFGTTTGSERAFHETGMQGHWWFVDSANGTQVTLVQNGSPTGDIVNIPDGSHLLIRRLPTLADWFEGLESTQNPNQWLAHAQNTNSAGIPMSNGSPFVHGDSINVISRQSINLNWAAPLSFMRSIPDSDITLKFENPLGGAHGTWQDLNNNVVDLSLIRLRPDEAVDYNAQPAAAAALGDFTPIWTGGFVHTSDVFAYVDSDPVDKSAVPEVDFFPTQNSGVVWYKLTAIGWPFPHDCKLSTGAQQTANFFESGLTTDPLHLGSVSLAGNLSSDIPPSDMASVFLCFSDPYDDEWQMFQQDLPNEMWYAWGDYVGDHSYLFEPRPLLRYIDPTKSPTSASATLRVNGHEELRTLRAGRGCYVVANRESGGHPIREWRMALPFRRP